MYVSISFEFTWYFGSRSSKFSSYLNNELSDRIPAQYHAITLSSCLESFIMFVQTSFQVNIRVLNFKI